jgi:DNA-binding GntR family transcriptional regulator
MMRTSERPMVIPSRIAVRRVTHTLKGVSPIVFRTIAEQVAVSIREAIAQGRIAPAARLLELSLAREMGTSRAPVREALNQLEREGLVVKEPNRGARVVELTEEMVREVASLRGLLEGFAASLAAERLTTAEFKTLDAILSDMDRAAQRGEYARLVELDYQFHAFICRASGHRTLYETWTVISGKVRLYLSTTNLMYRDLKAVVRGHGEGEPGYAGTPGRDAERLRGEDCSDGSWWRAKAAVRHLSGIQTREASRGGAAESWGEFARKEVAIEEQLGNPAPWIGATTQRRRSHADT